MAIAKFNVVKALVGLGASAVAGTADSDIGTRMRVFVEPPPAAVGRYVQKLWEQYDLNRDGILQQQEWQELRGQPARIDRDGDGVLTTSEMQQHVLNYAHGRYLAPPRTALPPHGDLTDLTDPTDPTDRPSTSLPGDVPPQVKPYYVPERFRMRGLPDWYVDRDANGDGQLALAEFTPTAEAQLVAQFERLDINHDGLLTPVEVLQETTSGPSSRSEGAVPNERPIASPGDSNDVVR
jgi:hypothetical protein